MRTGNKKFMFKTIFGFRNRRNYQGFTVMELMVVISIMMILTTAIVINLNKQRASRDVKIAQNQLVSDLRKIASYTLAARTAPGGRSAQYYLMRFDLTKPDRYEILAITNAASSPILESVEIIKLPANIKFDSAAPIIISQRLASPASQSFASSDCALVAFKAPFSKVILNKGCAITTAPSGISLTNTSDDFAKIINFQTNVSCDINNNPPACSASTDDLMTIKLADTANTVFRTIIINAVTGAITFN